MCHGLDLRGIWWRMRGTAYEVRGDVTHCALLCAPCILL